MRKLVILFIAVSLSSCSTLSLKSKDVVVSEPTKDLILEVPEKIKEVEVDTFDFRYITGAVIMLLLMLLTVSITRYIKEK